MFQFNFMVQQSIWLNCFFREGNFGIEIVVLVVNREENGEQGFKVEDIYMVWYE